MAPALIAAGLVIVLAQLYWPELPVVTAFAFITLGTTITTVARLSRTPSLRAGMALHVFVYSSLYLLLLGAICNAATRGTQGGLSLLQSIDLGLSAGVMAFVVKMCVTVIIGGGDAPAR